MLKSVEKKMKLSTIVMVSLTIFVLAINTNMAIAPPVVSPIDVNVTNTPNVNVVNTPTVNIGNIPTINIGAGQSVGIAGQANVTILNTSLNPVFIKDLDNLARQPIQATVSLTFTDNQGLLTDQDISKVIFPVFTKKTLVIEGISADAQLPQGEKIKIILRTQTDLGAGSFFIIPNLVGTFPQTPLSSFSNDVLDVYQQTTIYAKSGSDVVVEAIRNSSAGFGSVQISISGYFVDSQ